MKQRRSWSVVVLGTGLFVACDRDPSERADAAGSRAAQVTIVEGSGQSAAVASSLPAPLIVRVTDTEGRPLKGAPVAWRVAAGGGSFVPASVATDTAGLARGSWILGPQAGQQRLTASADGAQAVMFTADAMPGPAANVEKVSGDSLTGPAGLALTDSLVVRVTDAYGNPVPGAYVRWATAVPGGALSPARSITDEFGFARAHWTLGTGAGPSSAIAASAGVPPVMFTATATPQEVARLEKVTGDLQTAPAGTALPDQLVVRAVDAAGNPIAGVSVAWQVREGGGLIAPAITNTDQQGLARAAWTLGGTPGANTAIAAAAGEIVSFGATGAVQPPASGPE